MTREFKLLLLNGILDYKRSDECLHRRRSQDLVDHREPLLRHDTIPASVDLRLRIDSAKYLSDWSLEMTRYSTAKLITSAGAPRTKTHGTLESA